MCTIVVAVIIAACRPWSSAITRVVMFAIVVATMPIIRGGPRTARHTHDKHSKYLDKVVTLRYAHNQIWVLQILADSILAICKTFRVSRWILQVKWYKESLRRRANWSSVPWFNIGYMEDMPCIVMHIVDLMFSSHFRNNTRYSDFIQLTTESLSIFNL